ncbi:MAG TPA: PAC2 family protein [Anaerolineaceae bacterium]|nr:PAC2 family protein [Anaerolineaceae bacterium]
MTESYEFWRKPEAEEMYMIVGWRQWADAGAVSSGLPQYLIQQTNARKIGQIRPDGFYIFQVPGTHDLVRPVVRYVQGFPESLQTQQNEFYHTGDAQRGLIIFLGDEPHMDVERYIAALLDAARVLGVKRIIGLGGVYGEVPYDKERVISCNYSMPHLKQELEELAVTFSDYHGGASIGSYLCRRAGDQDMEYVGMYSFVPTYDFSLLAQTGSSIRIENDYRAWLGVMQRINYMLKIGLDLTRLEKKSGRLNDLIESKIEELENANPQLGVREYLQRLSSEFQEIEFSPLDDVWKENLRELLDKFEPGEDDDLPPED